MQKYEDLQALYRVLDNVKKDQIYNAKDDSDNGRAISFSNDSINNSIVRFMESQDVTLDYHEGIYLRRIMQSVRTCAFAIARVSGHGLTVIFIGSNNLIYLKLCSS